MSRRRSRGRFGFRSSIRSTERIRSRNKSRNRSRSHHPNTSIRRPKALPWLRDGAFVHCQGLLGGRREDERSKGAPWPPGVAGGLSPLPV